MDWTLAIGIGVVTLVLIFGIGWLKSSVRGGDKKQ